MKQPIHIHITAAFIAIVAILVLLTVILPAVHAQDATPEPTPGTIVTPAPVSDLTNNVLTDIETWLGTYGALVGTATLFIVQLLKGLPVLKKVDPRLINVGVSALLVIGLLVTTNFGYDAKYLATLDALPKVGTVLLSLLASFGFSTAFYEGAKAYGGKTS